MLDNFTLAKTKANFENNKCFTIGEKNVVRQKRGNRGIYNSYFYQAFNFITDRIERTEVGLR